MFQTLFQMLGMHIINTVEKIKFLYPPCLLGSIPPLRWGKIFCYVPAVNFTQYNSMST